MAKVLARVQVRSKAAKRWRRLVRLVRKIGQAETSFPAKLQSLRKWYEPLLESKYDDKQSRIAQIVQLEGIAARFTSPREFLSDLALDAVEVAPATGGSEERDCTILSTIHSAKSRQWPVVRILNVVEGSIPSPKSQDVEEERRLLHVAMTRAEEQLDLIAPERFGKYQQSPNDNALAYGSVSRFIPDSVRDAFECRRWPEN
ncbi:MAG: 3'-5' exonuclease [Xanthobacteraceae bacterium]